jgi:hypothetical protein
MCSGVFRPSDNFGAQIATAAYAHGKLEAEEMSRRMRQVLEQLS